MKFILYFFNKWLLNILYQPGILQLQNYFKQKKINAFKSYV